MPSKKEIYEHFKEKLEQIVNLNDDTRETARDFFKHASSINGKHFINEAYGTGELGDLECDLFSGATKFVMVDYDYRYVLKIGYLCEEAFRRERYNCANYCFLESYLYHRAAEYEGLQNILAETFFVGMYKGQALFAAKRFDVDSDRLNSEFSGVYQSNYEDVKEEDIPPFSDCYEEGAEMMISYIANDRVAASFNLFVATYDLGDFHDENWGYDGDELRCIDYTGFIGYILYK